MRRIEILAALFAVFALPLAAQARDTARMLPAQHALESPYATNYLLDVPFALKGAPGAPSGKKLSTITTEQTTNGAMRSDTKACQIAFLTALKRLQERVQQRGGDAVVEIVSVTQGTRSESPKDYRCVAGTLVVHVGLEGTIIDVE